MPILAKCREINTISIARPAKIGDVGCAKREYSFNIKNSCRFKMFDLICETIHIRDSNGGFRSRSTNPTFDGF